MIIYRRIFGSIDSKAEKLTIEKIFGIPLEKGYFSKDVDEKSKEYEEIKKYIDPYNLSDDIIGAEFSQKEIYEAEILWFKGAHAFSYPEPQEPKFLENTYSDVCLECGLYGRQKSDFEIKKEPNFSSNKLGMLHWVYGELFSSKILYEDFFYNLGIDKRSIKIYKTNKYVESAVQLFIPELDDNIDMNGLANVCCKVCNRIKYIPTVTGFFSLPEKRNFSIAKTREFFGTGCSASQRILMTNEIMKQMIEFKIAKAHQFVPCK